MSLQKYATGIESFREKINALRNTHFPVWEMERVSEFVAFAISKLSLLQVGDTAELIATIDIGPDSGWHHHRHMLVAGKRGEIIEVDWHDDEFTYLWRPESQTWISSTDGIERPITSPYHFMMSERLLRKVES